MKSDNELIAEFIGQHVTLTGLRRNVMQKSYYADELRYNTSFDWLMPAIKKIENLHSEKFHYDALKIAKGIFPEDNEYIDVICLPISTPIVHVHKAVVEFIKYYNETSHKNKS